MMMKRPMMMMIMIWSTFPEDRRLASGEEAYLGPYGICVCPPTVSLRLQLKEEWRRESQRKAAERGELYAMQVDATLKLAGIKQAEEAEEEREVRGGGVGRGRRREGGGGTIREEEKGRRRGWER